MFTSLDLGPATETANHHTDEPWYTVIFTDSTGVPGRVVGALLGALVGLGVGAGVAAGVGLGVGAGVGAEVGLGVGAGVGLGVGAGVGAEVGAAVGLTVGAGVTTGGVVGVGVLGVEGTEGGAAHVRMANETDNCMSKYAVHLPSAKGTYSIYVVSTSK